MLEKIINGLQNYFLGKNIIEYCEAEKELNPEMRKKFDKEKYLYLITGKIIPALAEGSAIAFAFSGNPYIGAVVLGAGEALRYEINSTFNKNKEYTKLTVVYAECHKKLKEINKYLNEHPEKVLEIREKLSIK